MYTPPISGDLRLFYDTVEIMNCFEAHHGGKGPFSVHDIKGNISVLLQREKQKLFNICHVSPIWCYSVSICSKYIYQETSFETMKILFLPKLLPPNVDKGMIHSMICGSCCRYSYWGILMLFSYFILSIFINFSFLQKILSLFSPLYAFI